MNFIKRAFLSLKQRKLKYALLLGVLFIIINFVLAGFVIRNASQEASDLARKRLGADVTLMMDFEKAMKKAKENGGVIQAGKTIAATTAKKLAKSPYVKDYNLKIFNMGIAQGFHPVQEESINDQNSEIVTNNRADLSIEGVRKSKLETNFKDGKSKLIDGKSITEDTKDQQVAMIEKRLAEKNHLKVGDEIKWKTEDGEIVKYKIIGIYETEEQVTDLGGVSIPAFMNPANKIYVPYESLRKVKQKSSQIQKAIYYLKDPVYIEKFKQEAMKSEIDFNIFKLDAHDQLYKQMSGPIKNIISISNLIIYIVSIAGGIILCLIIILSIRERRKEMGILLSIGEKKWKLIGQLMVEIVGITLIAFSLSLLTGQKVAQGIGDNLLAREVATNDKQALSSSNIIDMDALHKEQEVESIDKINVNVTPEDVKKVSGIGLGILILSTMMPALSIIRLKPKDILLKEE